MDGKWLTGALYGDASPIDPDVGRGADLTADYSACCEPRSFGRAGDASPSRRCVAFVGDHVAALARRIGTIALEPGGLLIVPALLSCNMQSTVNVADLEHLLARQHGFLVPTV